MINKITKTKVGLFTLSSILFFYIINGSSIGIAGLLEVTNGHGILDFEFGYSIETAYKILTNLGEEGREIYLERVIPLDLILPITYMLMLATWILFLLRHAYLSAKYQGLLIVPVSAMVFDWVENLSVVILLRSYPELSAGAVQAASTAGILKMCSIFASVGIIAILIIYNAIVRILRKGNVKDYE